MIIARIHRTDAARTPCRGCRAITLIELMIALSITVVTCGILAVLMNATAIGTNSSNDGRRSLVRLQSIKSVLQDEMANARAVLEVGSTYVVYWIGDQPGAATPANNAVNAGELRLLELDTTTGTLNLYKTTYPLGWSSSQVISADTTYPYNTSWYATCTTLKSGGYFNPTAVATGVTGLTVSLDSATPASAKLASFQVATYDGNVSRNLAFSVGLVCPQTPY